ncbi:hypothetical protein JKF63_03644 [Porcisia hertigi]|uniref:Uncharacterized protein n=1 Tax=Porcisia hertigi TaxID=2761500 RepID=A0A836IBK2_9TRYP|nr:hypothetical protein JKF63_03644 [Porcisia hertigi]
MERNKQVTASARTRTPSVNSRILRDLQSENETLRSELLQSKQYRAQLQRQLKDLRTASDKVVREVTASCQEQVHALEERCRLLADRLVGWKRGEQLTETARVGFLLRSQIEERRFLRRGLEAMQEVLAGAGGGVVSSPTSGQPRASVSTGPEDGSRGGEVHTGDLYRLMMTVSDALQVYIASAKLEKARIRLNLEQAASLLDELHDAVKGATRTAFDAAVQTSAFCDGDVFPPSSLLAAQPGTPSASAQSAGLFVPVHYRLGGFDGHPTGSADITLSVRGQDPTASSFAHPGPAPLPAAQLSLELEWVCDVLKACMRSADEVGTLIGAAAEGLKALPPLLQQRCDAGDHSSTSGQLYPLASSANPEIDALLRSFMEDLCRIKQQAARQQDDMARQLAQEVDRHFQSTEQYEQRMKLLEAECARLLRYVERQSTQGPGAGAMTQTPVRQSATVSTTLMPVLMPVQDDPVTPERYMASTDAPKLSEQRYARLSPEHSVATSHAFIDGQRTHCRVRGPKTPSEPTQAVFSAAASYTTRVGDPAHANHHNSLLSSPQDFSLNRVSSSPKFSRAAPPTVPSTAASEPNAVYQDPRVRPQHLPSEALPSPRGARHELSSSAAPRLSHKASTTISASTASAHSRSPGRRSTTASTPPRPRDGATFLISTPTATLSPASSAPERRSPVLLGNATVGRVLSHQRTCAAASHLPNTELPSPITAAGASRDATSPPSDTFVATSRPGQEGSRHHARSQQLYDEAAVDVFFLDSTSPGGAASSGSSVRRLRLDNSHTSYNGTTAEARTPSSRRPVKLTPYANRPLLAECAAPRTGQQLHTPPTRASEVLSRHIPGGGTAVDTSRGEESPSTPLIWRRIKEEVLSQRGVSSSPIVGDETSALFSTPREVPCAYA